MNTLHLLDRISEDESQYQAGFLDGIRAVEKVFEDLLSDLESR